jgi:hypothetical protein
MYHVHEAQTFLHYYHILQIGTHPKALHSVVSAL